MDKETDGYMDRHADRQPHRRADRRKLGGLSGTSFPLTAAIETLFAEQRLQPLKVLSAPIYLLSFVNPFHRSLLVLFVNHHREFALNCRTAVNLSETAMPHLVRKRSTASGAG